VTVSDEAPAAAGLGHMQVGPQMGNGGCKARAVPPRNEFGS